jgi:ribose transport system permease protein
MMFGRGRKMSRPRRRLSRVDAQLWSLAMVLLLVCVVFASLSDRFADIDNLRNVLLQSAPTMIGAAGMTFVIAARGIDLSIGAVANLALALALAVASTRAQATLTDSTWLVYPIALCAGVLLGALNAVAINVLRLSPLITTLGTLTLYRGLGLHLTGASLIAVRGPALDFGRTQIFGLGLPVYVALLFAAIGWWVLRETPSGRRLLALGGSPRSAAETGLRSARLLVLAYAISGLCGAVAGLVMVGRVGMINPDLGFGMEFTVITAVVLGGTSLFGGRASMLGTVLASVLLTAIDNGMTLIGANPYSYDVVRGLILLAAVSADAISAYFRGRKSPVVAALRL